MPVPDFRRGYVSSIINRVRQEFQEDRNATIRNLSLPSEERRGIRIPAYVRQDSYGYSPSRGLFRQNLDGDDLEFNTVEKEHQVHAAIRKVLTNPYPLSLCRVARSMTENEKKEYKNREKYLLDLLAGTDISKGYMEALAREFTNLDNFVYDNLLQDVKLAIYMTMCVKTLGMQPNDFTWHPLITFPQGVLELVTIIANNDLKESIKNLFITDNPMALIAVLILTNCSLIYPGRHMKTYRDSYASFRTLKAINLERVRISDIEKMYLDTALSCLWHEYEMRIGMTHEEKAICIETMHKNREIAERRRNGYGSWNRRSWYEEGDGLPSPSLFYRPTIAQEAIDSNVRQGREIIPIQASNLEATVEYISSEGNHESRYNRFRNTMEASADSVSSRLSRVRAISAAEREAFRQIANQMRRMVGEEEVHEDVEVDSTPANVTFRV